jgi:hypothetical protein
MNQYFIPIAVGACGLTLFLSLALYAFVHRGSGRVSEQATTETQDMAPKPGDGRRLIDWELERNRRSGLTKKYDSSRN